MPVVASQTAKPPQIQERSYALALRIVRLVRALPRDMATAVMARQVMRSGTSVGANIEEAQGSHSRKEFALKMNIARKEARETLYWLKLMQDAGVVRRGRLDLLIDEAEQIVRILVAIVKSTRLRGGVKPAKSDAS